MLQNLVSGPDRSSIVTIGPLGLLCLLGVTFFIGSRPAKRYVCARAASRATTNDSVRLSRIADASGKTNISPWGSARDISTPSSTNGNTGDANNLSGTTPSEGGRSRDAQAPSVAINSDIATNKEAVHGIWGNSRPVSSGPRDRANRNPQRSVHRIWQKGPGDESDPEQVSDHHIG